MAALSEGAEAADETDQTRDRLSLGQLMILIAGAAIGLGLLPLGAASHLPVFGPNGISWQGLVIALYDQPDPDDCGGEPAASAGPME